MLRALRSRRRACSIATRSAPRSHSPMFLGGGLAPVGLGARRPGEALLGARAGRGASSASRIHERTRGQRDRAPRAPGSLLATEPGAVRARQVLLATSAFPGLLGEIRRRVVPVWDYVLVTEPLERRAARGDRLGRTARGSATWRNRFHYSRLTADDRILWGGYDAIYDYGSGARPRAPAARADLRRPREPLLHRVPAARGDPLQPPLGRRDRHLQPLLRLPRDRARRPGRLHGRPHRARRRRQPLRGRGGARPARRARDRGHAAAGDALEAVPVPARAAALGGDRAHPQPARGGRPQGRPPRALAADARPRSGSASTASRLAAA